MPDGPQLKADDLIRDGNLDGSGKSPLFNSFVAEVKDDHDTGYLVGYSIGFFSYSTWQGKTFFLEDIYVKPEFRKFGIGKRLIGENVKFACEENCSRFDLHVLNWNPAKEFYELLQFTNLTETEGWEFYRLLRPEMDRLAASM